MKKPICLLLAIIICVMVVPDMTIESCAKTSKLTVGYIPLDNRPVNYQRVQWLAESVNIELLTPEEELFRTALDNMPPNSDGSKLGNRPKLLEWLKSTEGKCDYYIISLDQMLSGGLVGSRWYKNTDLTFEKSVCDYIAQLSQKYPIVLFDTVMRLASTSGFDGYGINEYNALRTYGSKARKILSGDNLTIDNIIKGYKYGTNGALISTTLSSTAIDNYIASRSRKLKLIDYLLKNCASNLDYCFIGVDDSSPNTSIQTNEIAYIKRLIGTNGNIAAATDEFGMMGIARVLSSYYGGADVTVEYYGGGENQIADSYDYDTLKNAMNSKLQSLKCNVTNDNKALKVLIYTKCNNSTATANSIIAKAKQYISQGCVVAIIDPSASGGVIGKTLAGSDVPLLQLIGYSSWNTAANSLGLGFSMAIARYLYLNNAKYVTQDSHIGFIKTMTFAYIKDISYKNCGFRIEDAKSTAKNGFIYMQNKINSSPVVTSLNPYTTVKCSNVVCSDYVYPWNRTFEMVCKIAVDDVEHISGDIDGDGRVGMLDYVMAKRISDGKYSPSNTQKNAADTDGNGNINSKDCDNIKKAIQKRG